MAESEIKTVDEAIALGIAVGSQLAEAPKFESRLTEMTTIGAIEPDEEEPTLQDITDQLDLTTLGLLVAQKLFGDQIDEPKENLFFTRPLDETEPLQAEFGAKIADMFEANKIIAPESLVMQVFGRQAGFLPKEKEWEYAMVVGINDYQVISHQRVNHVVSRGSISSLFEISEEDIPRVPKTTKVKLPKGKATIKPRNYMAIIVWAFWNEYPELKETPAEPQGGDLGKALEFLKAQGVDVDKMMAEAEKEYAEAETEPGETKPLIL